MFYNRGEVISGQLDHFKVIGFWVNSGKKSAQTGLFGNFFLEGGGGGPLFPNVYVRILTKGEIFVKTKNASWDLKCTPK